MEFENPFVLSASPCTDELEMVREGLKAGWAGAVLKTTHVKEVVFEPVCPLIKVLRFGDKVVGLGNIDLSSKYNIDEIEKRVSKLKREFPNKIVMASIVAGLKKDWQYLVRRLENSNVDAIEISTGCPQIHPGLKPGEKLSQNLTAINELVKWLKEVSTKPIIMKITEPTNVALLARTVKEAGADGVVTGNPSIHALMGIDLESFVPYPSVANKSTFSGYMGAAMKPVSLRVISEIAKNVKIPISGVGGVTTWQDAVEFILVGASTIQVCTAVMLYGYRIIDHLTEGLNDYLERKNIENVSKLRGKSLIYIVPQDELSRKYKIVVSIDKEKCIRDRLCYIACKNGGHTAIELDEEGYPKVDEEKCLGCGLCKEICPVLDCISFKEV